MHESVNSPSALSIADPQAYSNTVAPSGTRYICLFESLKNTTKKKFVFRLKGEVFGRRIAVDSDPQIIGHNYAEG